MTMARAGRAWTRATAVALVLALLVSCLALVQMRYLQSQEVTY